VIVRHIRGRGAIATLITNAYLPTPAMFGRLNAAGLDSVQISIDNVSPDDVSKKSLNCSATLRDIPCLMAPDAQRDPLFGRIQESGWDGMMALSVPHVIGVASWPWRQPRDTSVPAQHQLP
jgi:hypothetical protein